MLMGVSKLAQRVVLIAISNLATMRPNQPLTQTDIAAESEMSARHVRNTIPVLVDNGCLVVIDGGQGKPYRFQINRELVEDHFGWTMPGLVDMQSM